MYEPKYEYPTYAPPGAKCGNCGFPLAKLDLSVRDLDLGQELTRATYLHAKKADCEAAKEQRKVTK